MAALQTDRLEASRIIKILSAAVIVFVLLFLFLSLLALGPIFLPTLTYQDHFLLCVGEGRSMEPYIFHGDYIIVDVTPENLEIGDIIVYVHDGILIGHRIVKIVDDGFITKGDNNLYPDPWIVKRRAIIGEVEWIIRDNFLKRIAELWFERANWGR